jgi:gluconate 2-dehydrogenase gamma chain
MPKPRSKNLLKSASNHSKSRGSRSAKKGPAKTQKSYLGPLASGLNRRAFLKTSIAISLLGGLAACKPAPTSTSTAITDPNTLASTNLFTKAEKITLTAVQLQLFPDDGNGPSALELNALQYLELAMQDPQNIDDGDPTQIKQGCVWLNQLAEDTQGDAFAKLKSSQQDKVLKQIAQSREGERWLSLLLYYLTEALALDPVYGGNPDQIGWQWLEHQPGFPLPVAGKTYRDFD